MSTPLPTNNDALALEYQRYYGGASRDIEVEDLVNNPSANGVCRVFGFGLSEQGLDLLRAELRSSQR